MYIVYYYKFTPIVQGDLADFLRKKKLKKKEIQEKKEIWALDYLQDPVQRMCAFFIFFILSFLCKWVLKFRYF